MHAWEQLSDSNLASSTWFFPINWTGKRWQIAFPTRYSIFLKLCHRLCWFSFSIDYWILVTYSLPISPIMFFAYCSNKGRLLKKRSDFNPEALLCLSQVWFYGFPGHVCLNIYLKVVVLSGDRPNRFHYSYDHIKTGTTNCKAEADLHLAN